MKTINKWHVYLLYNSKINRTYIGCTTDYKRRLRQHNGELSGGAKSTKKGAGHWHLHAVLSGFKDRSEVMRWEKLLKLRCWGLKSRLNGFKLVSEGICPGKGKHYEVPKGIKLL
jgi:predicted GIY-YIG superfamily endonuclease